VKRAVWSSLSAKERAAIIRRPAMSGGGSIAASARAVVDDVRARGDSAVREYAKKFDKVELKDFTLSTAGAEKKIADGAAAAIRAAYDNIYAFHAQQGYKAYASDVMPGVRCAREVRPIGAVGLYVPGGTAPLVSTTLMLGVPSRIAGCPARVLCTPSDDPHILYAAHVCGINKVYRIGGAQAIAAMAFGTESVPKVDKIFGPGNAYVTAAKRIVAEDAGGAALDMPAGPSEVCVVADETTSPVFAAADLLSQAEHDTMSQVMLIALSETMAKKIEDEVKKQIATLSRKDIAVQTMANSVTIIAKDMDEAMEISNLYAPEHLLLCFSGAEKYVGAVQHAGSVFVGEWSTESAGDYCSGTNHVLPTYGHARAYSGLGVEAFQKTITVQALTREGLKALSGTITALAELEGLDAHARAVKVRA
jgi:histidinol dehydrogenase